MSDLVTQAKDALASTLTKVDDALASAAPTSAESEGVPDPVTGTTAPRPAPPARKASSASDDKIAALYDHRQEHKAELLGRGVLKGASCFCWLGTLDCDHGPPTDPPLTSPFADDKVAPALQAKQEALRRAQLGVSSLSRAAARDVFPWPAALLPA